MLIPFKKLISFRLQWSVITAVLFLAVLFNGDSPVALAGDSGGATLDFDGVNDHVSVSGTWGGATWTEATIEAWVLVQATSGGFQAIVSSTNLSFIHLQLNNSGGIAVYTNAGGINLPIIPQTPINQWRHIAVVVQSGNSRLYQDGVQFGGTDTTAFTNLVATPNNGLRIGEGYQDLRNFNGLIEDVRIWNVARTQAEIQQDMFRQFTPAEAAAEANLVGYWPMNNGSGQTVTGLGSGGNNGTLGANPASSTDDPTWIANSTAPIGDPEVTAFTDVVGMWAGDVSASSSGLIVSNNSFLAQIGDDIIFGHNNAAFNCCVTTDIGSAPNTVNRWGRIWELDKYDVTDAANENVDLTFDISDYGGSGNFDPAGNYYLLSRPTGSSASFTEVPVASTNISGDQVTFTVDVDNIGSEFTLGAGPGSPTAISLQNLNSNGVITTPVIVLVALLFVAGSIMALFWYRRLAV